MSAPEPSAAVLEKRANRDAYWRKNLRVIGLLLLAWFVVTFVLVYFARELSFKFFGWPFSFWVAGQGALATYCVIIWVYARYMARLDAKHGVVESED
jgi:putative solute:sodium symporter small subunit